MPEGSRYIPIKDTSTGGILLLKDNKPDENQDIIEPVVGEWMHQPPHVHTQPTRHVDTMLG